MGTSFRRFADELDGMVAAAQANGAIADRTIRQRLMRYHTRSRSCASTVCEA